MEDNPFQTKEKDRKKYSIYNFEVIIANHEKKRQLSEKTRVVMVFDYLSRLSERCNDPLGFVHFQKKKQMAKNELRQWISQNPKFPRLSKGELLKVSKLAQKDAISFLESSFDEFSGLSKF